MKYLNYKWLKNNSKLILRINKKNYKKFSDIVVKVFNSFNDSPNDSMALSVKLEHPLFCVISIALNKINLGKSIKI